MDAYKVVGSSRAIAVGAPIGTNVDHSNHIDFVLHLTFFCSFQAKPRTRLAGMVDASMPGFPRPRPSRFEPIFAFQNDVVMRFFLAMATPLPEVSVGPVLKGKDIGVQVRI